MDIPVRRISKDLPLPEYKTAGAVAMDCVLREGAIVPPQGLAYVPLNIAVQIPKGYFILMAARSSLHKRGLMMANSVAIFDEDFCGDSDEYKAVLFNFTNEAVEVKAGERLTQLMLMPYERITWSEVERLEGPDRGGYGTTGH